MKNLGQLMKQAQQMQTKMAELQSRLAEVEVDGSSGGGMVKVTVNGKGELKRIKIDPSLCVPEDVEMLEDLVVAAFSDGKGKTEGLMQGEIEKLTGGLPLPPGFKLPF